MGKVIIHAEVYTGETVIADGFVRFGKEISAVGNMAEYVAETDEEVIDASGSRLVPGFIDVHSHGGYGMDNMDGDADEINRMIGKMHQEGITSYFPTTMTQSNENIEKALVGIRKAAEKNPVIQGVHLEGPFISAVFKGAQPEEHIKLPDADLMRRWQELSGGLIRLVTYAPETSDATAFEKYCLDNQIVLSVGHSNARRSQLQQSKASHITHLYNAQRGLHHREPGVTGHAFLEDDIYVEMIVDGLHIDPEMVKIAFKQKGADRIELITDAMRAKGMGDGISELGGQKVIVKDGEARLESGNLAGSVLEFQKAFENVISFTGCSISDAVKMSSVNQAREFGLVQKGSIAPGKDADMVLLSKAFTVERTISFGKTVFNKNGK
ncbi:N-acetylglucosamine-6-phosphate deacetylase [Trichococcus shcherbakoviae]|jgi:N-acetylglucosamine-6-phosphate deacetylase|uniref:N-acetylglucosamine-6-phosphate deacetylase n=1 Tax=Trichococcus shcherbakoviae subsp. psychrophilus TaxID=2585775 RepID=A0A5C5E6S0_9LACT|nr:N-acetylglucosamine-6-phosphate deacetylase [Trichococcus shcherbakoviae]OUL07748.1 N-acetylglucosamine-6-phosphate deacetylase [Sedimentibacter sp. SX930]TNV67962.1 N-acetylglucosamine-6-phosphate deacetylase [Trichococcus shcherbakoviae subsp. psychrophilus]TNV69531.1 N-acetylglucosamine-6-phosphate deacetylase [Trichococcus shcherbakoviae subsp. psychrophilus]